MVSSPNFENLIMLSTLSPEKKMPLCPYILKCVHRFRGFTDPLETQLRKLKDLTSHRRSPTVLSMVTEGTISP